MTHTLDTRPVRTPGLAPTPSGRQVFVAVVRSEWTKLRTLRSTLWALVFTVVVTIGLGALICALEVSRWNTRSVGEATGFDPALYSFVGMNLAHISVGVLGVLVMTSEYATRTIGLTFAAAPQRQLVLAAKIATFAVVVAVVGIVATTVTFLVGQAVFGPTHGGLSITDPGAVRAVFGAVGYLVLVGILSLALGACIRRTAASVAVLFAILLVVPGLVTFLPSPWNDDVTKFLPSSAGTAMAAVARFPDLLAPGPGLLVLLGYTALAVAVAAVTLSRRDA